MKARLSNKYFLILALAMALTFACGPKSGSKNSGIISRTAVTGTVNGSPVNGGGQYNSSTGWGQITVQGGPIGWGNQPSQYPQQDPDDVVRWFLTRSLEPSTVGATAPGPDPTFNLPCQSYQNCGVGLSMNLQLPSALSQAMQMGTRITNGTITILVYDSLVGTPDPSNGQAIQAFGVTMQLNPSYNNGIYSGQVTLEFADSLGTVDVRAQLAQGGMLQGAISFTNFTDFNGDTGGAFGNLGSFTLPACSAFSNCQ